MKIPTTTDIPQRYTWCLAGICYSSLAILPSFLGRDADLVVMVDCQIPSDDLIVHFF